jgi:hypothetical protein
MGCGCFGAWADDVTSGDSDMVGDMSIDHFHQNIRLGGGKEIAARWFISGIEEGLSWANSELKHKQKPLLYCQPDIALTNGQIIDILDRYIGNHKESVNNMPPDSRRVGLFLLLALQEAFPC